MSEKAEQDHYLALVSMYKAAPVNAFYLPEMVVSKGEAVIEIEVSEKLFHSAGAVHGSVYFKMLDDAGFYAANTFVTDRFLLTTSFNLHFTKPVRVGQVVAEGRWVSGRKRVFVAESRLVDDEGDEIGRGTGTFMRSHIPLSSLPGYLTEG